MQIKMVKFLKKASIFWVIISAFWAVSFCQAREFALSDDPNPNVVEKNYSVCPGGNCSIPNPLGETTIIGLITKIVQFLVENIAIPLAVIMIIWTGFKFVTAQGNATKLEGAKKNLLYTVIGLAVILSAEAIVLFIRNVLGEKNAPESPLLDRLKGALNEIIGVLFALATVYFAWGVVQMIQGSGNEKKIEEGRRHMIWGIIGMAVMAGAWGIVALLKNFLGI